nr:TolC family outer membrane protein [Entomohabitans teleogrylli]
MVPEQNLPSLQGRVTDVASQSVPETLSIDRAVERAAAWHPDISTEVGKLFQAQEQVNVAESRYYPQISGGVNNGVTNNYGYKGYSPSLVLSVSQLLYDFGKVSSSVREANAGVAMQQAKVLLSIDNTAHDVAATLVQVQGYQQLVTIAREQLDALNSIASLAEQRNNEGASNLSDVVQTRTRIEGAQATLIQYQASLDRWRASLASYLGWQTVNRVSDDFPNRLTRACEATPTDDQPVPSVLAAWAQANQAAAQLDGANAELLPTITLEPEVTHYLNDRYANHDVQDRTQYSAWVRVKMPLYQGGGLTAARNAAQHTLESANASLKSARLTASQQLDEARNEASGLTLSLNSLQRQQKLGEETRQLYQDQYLQLGTRPLLDVLNVEQEIYQTRFSEQQTISKLRSLQLDCLYSTGKIRQAFALNNQSIQGVEIQP